VKVFDESKGFGFITGADDAKDYFMHFSAIKTDDGGFSTLSDQGQLVEFTGDDGKPMALDVTVLAGAPDARNGKVSSY
jgi:cold shock protein